MNDTAAKKAKYRARPTDVDSPQSLVKAMYQTISGPAGERNWSRLRSLYIEDARLIPTGNRVHRESGFEVMGLEQWIEDVRPWFLENDFWESEIMHHADRFGDIVQVFSTYDARNSEDGQPFARGINSIQLVFKDDRWWIVSCMWANESKDNPVPGEFLPYLW